jgi:hypothetical protein
MTHKLNKTLIAKVRMHTADGPKTVPQLAGLIGIEHHGLECCLRYMRLRGEARRDLRERGKPATWVAVDAAARGVAA